MQKRIYDYVTKKYDTLWIRDTFDLNSWITFYVPQVGLLNFNANLFHFLNDYFYK